MFPLALSDTLQQIIVTATISLAAIAIVRILLKSRKPKPGACAKCNLDH